MSGQRGTSTNKRREWPPPGRSNQAAPTSSSQRQGSRGREPASQPASSSETTRSSSDRDATPAPSVRPGSRGRQPTSQSGTFAREETLAPEAVGQSTEREQWQDFREALDSSPGPSSQSPRPTSQDSQRTVEFSSPTEEELSFSVSPVIVRRSMAHPQPVPPSTVMPKISPLMGSRPQEQDNDASELFNELVHHIDTNAFHKISEYEVRFFNNPKFKDHELKRAMDYALYKAESVVEDYRRLLDDPDGVPTLQTFADWHGGDQDPENVIHLDFLPSADVYTLRVDSKFRRTLAALCKIRKAAEEACKDVKERMATEDERQRALLRWCRDASPLHARPRCTPVFLLDPSFTQSNIHELAIYAKNRRLRWINKYQTLKRDCDLEQLRGFNVVDDEELSGFGVSGNGDDKPLPITTMTDEDIRNWSFKPVERPFWNKMSKDDFEKEKPEKFHAKMRKQVLDHYKESFTKEERRNHSAFLWSIALVAKGAKQAEVALEDLLIWLGHRRPDSDELDEDFSDEGSL